jgi:large subunit ribosomal protein L2
MTLVKSKPTSPGRRFQVKIARDHLHKGGPVSSLVSHKHSTGARNHFGRQTVRHQGGGHKQRYRMVDFLRSKDGVPGKVERIEYDPNRTAHLALVLYADGERRYIIAPKGVTAGDSLMSGPEAPIKSGNSMQLRHIPVGTTIHCVELKPGKGAAPAVPHSSPLATVSTQPFVCVRRRPARFMSIAAPPSVKLATTNTACAATAKPVRSAGAVFVRRCVEW